MTPNPHPLPTDITVFERGWLSSNNILLCGDQATALVDSGYGSHAPQTLALVRAALGDRPLDRLVNTHLHSDHCGGNATLQAAYPALQTLIPPGLARHVKVWDPVALTYTPTGQSCPQFRFDAVLVPDTEIQLGNRWWQVHAAPGHDTHSVVLFEAAECILISADALWEKGFGVVFPELEGEHAFAAVGETIDLIEALAPAIVVPGHGPVFTDIARAIRVARDRLEGFVTHPAKHTRHAAKVLLKFRLLEVRQQELASLQAWAHATPYFAMMFNRQTEAPEFSSWVEALVADLVRVGAAAREGSVIRNTG